MSDLGATVENESPLLAAFASAPLAIRVLTVLGALVATRIIVEKLVLLYNMFLRPSKAPTSFGKWGIVTGATDGIGKALAMELARKGQNVVLMSRTQWRLEAVRDEILAKYPTVDVKVLAVDFNRIEEPTVRASIEKMVAEIYDVGVLINNVGVSYEYPMYFDEFPLDRVNEMIKLNVEAMTYMTKIVLPGMAERRRGVIVSLSSGVARIHVPMYALYPATKRFVESLTGSLAAEFRSKNVHFQTHTPMFVATKLANLHSSSITTCSPETYARASIAALGHGLHVRPYWPHALEMWVYETLPTWVSEQICLTMHPQLRERHFSMLKSASTTSYGT